MLLIIQSGVTIKEKCRGKMWESTDIPANMDFFSPRWVVKRQAQYTAPTPRLTVLPAGGGTPRPAALHIPGDERKHRAPGLSV